MILLLHGPDALSRSEEIAKLQSQLGDATMIGLNSTRLNGRQISAKELIQVCSALPFLAEKRLVIVDDLAARVAPAEGEEAQTERSTKGKKQNLLKEILEYLPSVPETTYLVFNEEDDISERHPLRKQIATLNAKSVRNFALPKNEQLDRWITQRAKGKKAQIEPEAVRALAVYVGSNLRLLDNELEKLAIHAQGRPITMQDVHRLVSYVREESVFRFVDALGEKKGALATSLFHQLLEDNREMSQILPLLSMIVRQFRQLVQVKELTEQGVEQLEITKILHLPYASLVGNLQRQARNFTIEQIEDIYAKLQQIDVGIKTGRAEGELALDLFIAESCGSGKSRPGVS